MAAELLTQFNELPVAAARAELLDCCSSPHWADRMTEARPFATLKDAVSLSAEIVSAMTAADLSLALAGHPRIGAPRETECDPERDPDRSARWSRQEQALVSTAGGASHELAEANLEYEQRFGHIYLVSASGRTGPQLLALLRTRLRNDDATEWQVVRSELQHINGIRLRRLLAGAA
jgi:OHCU decarboxylase